MLAVPVGRLRIKHALLSREGLFIEQYSITALDLDDMEVLKQ